MSFKKPDLSAYGPVPFWFWNDKLDRRELLRQVRLTRDGGVRNFIVHARWGLRTPYLGREWWSLLRSVLGEAERCGSRVWLYDEYNYPSGIAGFKLTRQARFRERFLAVSTARGRGPKPLRLAAPKGALLGAFAVPLERGRLKMDESRPLPLNARSGARWSPPDGREWSLSAFAMAVEPFRGSGKYSVNYLDPDATRAFIRTTHDAYAKSLGSRLGRSAPAFFLDEPRFNNALPWDGRLPGWFKARHGYDILPQLPLLLLPGADGGHRRLRQDYYGLLGELFSEHFFAPIARWCRAHKVGLTGHLMAEETLAASTRYSGDALKPYAQFEMPGVDHLGKGFGGLAPKMVASAARRQRKDRVSCEAFAGCGQDFRPEEMNAITHWLFSQGVNLIIPHAFFYAFRTRRQRADWPPSMFFQWEHWPSYPAYAARVARLSEALSGGKSEAEIAMLHPGRAFQADYVADPAFKTGYFKRGPALKGRDAARLERWYQAMGSLLQNGHRSFQIVGDADLAGLEGSKALLLPAGLDLDAPARKALERFQRGGGRVHRGADPKALLAAAERALPPPSLRLIGSPRLRGRRRALAAQIEDPYVHRGLMDDLRKDRMGVSIYPYRRRGETLFFLANQRLKESRFEARWTLPTGRAELRWPGSGRCETLDLRRSPSGGSAEVRIPALEAVILAIRP